MYLINEGLEKELRSYDEEEDEWVKNGLYTFNWTTLGGISMLSVFIVPMLYRPFDFA